MKERVKPIRDTPPQVMWFMMISISKKERVEVATHVERPCLWQCRDAVAEVTEKSVIGAKPIVRVDERRVDVDHVEILEGEMLAPVLDPAVVASEASNCRGGEQGTNTSRTLLGTRDLDKLPV